MICVECSAPINYLYEQYKGGHIRLAVCKNCHRVADKYIEYDSVLLFIDLMLLKPQAYKHTIYNSLILDKWIENPCEDLRNKSSNKSSRQASQGPSKELIDNKDHSKQTAHFFETYGFVIRLSILLQLFEIYIKWAYEEKNYVDNPQSASLVIKLILNGPLQYLFFLSTVAIESLALNFSLTLLVRKYLQFGLPVTANVKSGTTNGGTSNSGSGSSSPLTATSSYDAYYNQVLLSTGKAVAIISSTILVSNAIKLFPIVMLIWPYDNLILNVTRILIQLVHFAILVEALSIVTLNNVKNQYTKLTAVVLISELFKFTVTHLVMDYIFHYCHGVSWSDLLNDELRQIDLKFQLIEKLADKFLSYLSM